MKSSLNSKRRTKLSLRKKKEPGKRKLLSTDRKLMRPLMILTSLVKRKKTHQMILMTK